jgi:hypothetical protein
VTEADASAGPALHPALADLGGLVGTFEGPGHGDYPTIAPFDYHERVVLGHDGRPVLAYRQRTWRPDRSAPMHLEAGYLRALGEGRVELVVAQPTGVAEVHAGRCGPGWFEVASTAVARTASAKDVRSVRRRFALDGATLVTDLWMSYAGHHDTHHLRSTLRRVDA